MMDTCIRFQVYNILIVNLPIYLLYYFVYLHVSSNLIDKIDKKISKQKFIVPQAGRTYLDIR